MLGLEFTSRPGSKSQLLERLACPHSVALFIISKAGATAVDSALGRKVAVACFRPQTDLEDSTLSEMTNTWMGGSLEIESNNVGLWEGMRISVNGDRVLIWETRKVLETDDGIAAQV